MRIIPKKILNWNPWDEFALLNGLGHFSEDGKSLRYVRYPGESNKQLRDRTKKAMEHRGNSTKQGLVNSITRDLGISVSGHNLIDEYKTDNKYIYHLSEPPYPEASGSGGEGNIRVYVSSSGGWSAADRALPQVRASGYSNAVSGWIVWNYPDHDPTIIPSGLPESKLWYERNNASGLYTDTVKYGEYTRILEFIGDSIPNTNHNVKVEYRIKTDEDDYGQSVLNWRSDYSHPDTHLDISFTGKQSSIPSTLGTFAQNHIMIYDLYDLKEGPASGYFYNSAGEATDKLIKLSEIVNKEYPMTWGKFRYDIGRWDQLNNASIGVIPSFHDEANPTGDYRATMYGGNRYGTDLDMVGIKVAASGAHDYWYPKLQHGEFYWGDERYYMFAKKQHEVVDFTAVGTLLSGTLTASGINAPGRLEMVAGYSSGVYFGHPDVSGLDPYIARTHEFSNPISGIYYRTPFVSYSGGLNVSSASGINYDDGHAFHYSYDTREVWASGIEPTGMPSSMVVVWDHQTVATSGLYTTFSGGYGYGHFDGLNPLVDMKSKIYYLNR